MLDKMNAAICSHCDAAVPIAEIDRHGECAECVSRKLVRPSGAPVVDTRGAVRIITKESQDE